MGAAPSSLPRHVILYIKFHGKWNAVYLFGNCFIGFPLLVGIRVGYLYMKYIFFSCCCCYCNFVSVFMVRTRTYSKTIHINDSFHFGRLFRKQVKDKYLIFITTQPAYHIICINFNKGYVHHLYP